MNTDMIQFFLLLIRVHPWLLFFHNRFLLRPSGYGGQVASTQGHNKEPYGRGKGGKDWVHNKFFLTVINAFILSIKNA
jgi:hypothetical protein